MVSYSDKTLKCRECGLDFVFTAGEQEFYASKGLQNEPQRCPSCRAIARRERYGRTREMHTTTCAECGETAQVPFVPRNDRPVYCSSCFDKIRLSSKT